jgi:hypothetical protein
MVRIFSEAQEVNFTDVALETANIIFRHAHFQKCLFLNTDLSKVHLVDVTWPQKGRFYDEILSLESGEKLPCGQLETLYRQLKRNYEEQRDYERAGNFHYGEKEMRLRNLDTSWWHRHLLLWPYWLIGGYGERIWRPLVWAVFVLVAGAFVYLFCGLTPTLVESLEYSFRVMTLQKPQDFVLSGSLIKCIYTLQGLIGPLLLGLTALAVRQRLKR